MSPSAASCTASSIDSTGRCQSVFREQSRCSCEVLQLLARLKMGSSLTCNGAAAEAQRNRIRSQLPDDASQPGAVLGGGAMQKMLPLRKILAGFRKAAVEPTWRAAFNAADSTRGRGALCKLGRLTQPAEVFCCGAARGSCRSLRLRGFGTGELTHCGTKPPLQPLLPQKTLVPAVRDFRQRSELPVCGHSVSPKSAELKPPFHCSQVGQTTREYPDLCRRGKCFCRKHQTFLVPSAAASRRSSGITDPVFQNYAEGQVSTAKLVSICWWSK